jgi:exosortase A-associated hydrolase 2
VKPFFFGDSARPLFGIHHPPEGPRRRGGVLVCNPFGQEALRAHRCLRDLATRLATTGFDVLRFDYTGCGDSAGPSEAGTVGQWLDDVAAAAEELTEMARTPRLAMVGLRLGGTLAALHARQHAEVGALVLWDPVVNGREYFRELETTHRTWMKDHAHREEEGEGALREVLGFPLTETLAGELETLDLSRLETGSGLRALVVTSAGADAPAVGIDDAGGKTERASFPPAPVWLHAEGMDRVLVPTALLEHVTRWLETACR